MGVDEQDATHERAKVFLVDGETVVLSEEEALGVLDINARYEKWEPVFRKLLYAAMGAPTTQEVEPGVYRHTWEETESN